MKIDEKNNKERIPFEHYKSLYEKLDPAEAATRCGLLYDQEAQEFELKLLNQEYRISFPDYTIRAKTPKEGEYYALMEFNAAEILILRYLTEGRHQETSGKMLAYRDMPWGEVYYQQFNGRCILRLGYGFGGKLDQFERIMQELDGTKVESGDCAYKIEFLNNLFITFILWEGDDEFPPAAQILFSDNFPAAFQAEDMAVVGDISIGTMKKLASRK